MLPAKVQNNITTLLSANMKALKTVLPKHLTPERVMRIAYIAIQQNQKLAECSHASLINAILESSILGLEISTPLGHAHLIPYGKKATLIIGYLGFLDLAYRSGKISKFSMQPVYEKDHFRYQYGTNPFIEHMPSDAEDVGDLKYAYAIAQFKDGSTEFEVVNKRTAMATKARSAAKNKKDSPWNTVDEWMMWCKTAVRKLAKRLPMSSDIQRAAMLDEYAEAGIKQNISYIPDEGDAMVESATDLTQKLKNDAKFNQNASEPQRSINSKKTGDNINGGNKKQRTKSLTPKQQLLGIVKSMDPAKVEHAILNIGMSETTEIDSLPHDQLKDLVAMVEMIESEGK